MAEQRTRVAKSVCFGKAQVMSRLLLLLVFALSLAVGCKSKPKGPEPLILKIEQRNELPVPGTNGEARISISDIRNGNSARLTITDDLGTVVATGSMGTGDTLDFEFYSMTNKSTQRYRLRVDRYQDGIVIDFAYLSFMALPDLKP